MVSMDDILCSVIGVGCLRIGMVIVLVKVKCKGSDIVIIMYVFLDSGSSFIFCMELLMK